MTPSQRIDLRSDTLTVPDRGMRQAMAGAEVGDDVWGEDPTVQRLEVLVAGLLGKEAAVYVPSGTMGNLLAVAAQTSPGDEVVLDRESHITVYEVGGTALVAGVQLRTLDFVEGIPTAAEVGDAVRAPNIHHPVSRLLCVENTHNRRGGAALEPAAVRGAAAAAHGGGMRVHCDGARLFNAAVALDCPPAALVDSCDTVMVALSKGLGCPVGSLLAGDTAVIEVARRWRKRLGGGMRQVGILAAAGLYAFEHNLQRLAEDHANAARLASALGEVDGYSILRPRVPTNMVMLRTVQPAEQVQAAAAREGLLATLMGPNLLRCMTYNAIDAAMVDEAAAVLARAAAGVSAPA